MDVVIAELIAGYGALSSLDYMFRRGMRGGEYLRFRADMEEWTNRRKQGTPDAQKSALGELKQHYTETDKHLRYDVKVFGRWVPDPLLLPWRIASLPYYLVNGRKHIQPYDTRPKV